MGRYIDFRIKYDPLVDKDEDIAKRIIWSLVLSRLAGHKPVVWFIGGDSGEGKSFAALKIQEILAEGMNIDNLKDVLDYINVYTPLQYPEKLNQLLYNKELKKVHMICMHEARTIIKAKMWQSFLTQAVSDVNAMSRSIKRMCFFIISQFIRDITSDTRYTLTYYSTATRPLKGSTKLRIEVMWKDDSDLEKPKLKKRGIRGYLVYPDGSCQLYCPQYLELTKPNKEVADLFEEQDRASKSDILRKKMDKLISEMRAENEILDSKVDGMVEFYANNQENLKLVARTYRGKYRILPEAKIMHNLTDTEIKDFQEKLTKKLESMGQLKIKEMSDEIEEAFEE